MRGWLTWLAAGAVAACYSPRPTESCEVICNAAEGALCPDGFTCGASGLCSVDGMACQGDDLPGSCFGTGIAKPCVPTIPRGSLMLSGLVDTDTDPRCVRLDQPVSGPQLCVIAGERIVIGEPAHAVGTRPLVLVAIETIAVDAMLDVRSVRIEPVTGAGAIACPTPFGVGEGPFGTGGAGGAFQGRGGLGGGANGLPQTMPEDPVAFPDHVRGGCPGGAGGPGTSAVVGEPGAGGGALVLIAKGAIDVQGVIAANGAGGYLEADDVGARLGGGGGGGGSGGLIVLEAPFLRLAGGVRVLAVGGGGAGGGGSSELSRAGADPDPVGSPAAGGQGGAPDGGAGGNGSSILSPNGASGGDGTVDGGGGGGGGGAGFIQLICTMCSTTGAIIIPLPIS